MYQYVNKACDMANCDGKFDLIIVNKNDSKYQEIDYWLFDWIVCDECGKTPDGGLFDREIRMDLLNVNYELSEIKHLLSNAKVIVRHRSDSDRTHKITDILVDIIDKRVYIEIDDQED